MIHLYAVTEPILSTAEIYVVDVDEMSIKGRSVFVYSCQQVPELFRISRVDDVSVAQELASELGLSEERVFRLTSPKNESVADWAKERVS